MQLDTLSIHYILLLWPFTVDENSLESRMLVLHETILMKDFDHPNVLNVLGVGINSDNENGLPFIVLPFMVNGDLKTYLKSKRQKPGVVDQLPKVCI